MTISAQDAHEYPIYNARFRLIVPLFDADGDPISPSAPDTEISQDLGTFADATNEATEIATASGIVYVDLVAGEMDTKSTVVQIKSTGAKTTVAVLNPRRLPVVRTGTAQTGGASNITLDAGASAIDNFYVGCWVNITNNTPTNAQGQARRIIGYVGSTKAATIEGTWGTNPSSSSTFEILLTAEANTVLAHALTNLDATVSSRASQTSLNTVDDFLDTEIAAILAAVDTEIADIQSRLPAALVGGRMSADVVAISGDTAAADALELAFDATAGPVPELGIIDRGTAQSATGTTLVLRAAAAFANDEIIGATVLITGGSAGVGQARTIVDYVSSTDTATVDAWTTTPTGTITYEIFAGAPASNASPPAVNLVQVNGAAQTATLDTLQADTNDLQARLPAALVSGRIDASVGAMAANVLTASAINADAITAAKIAADAGAEIADAVWAKTMTEIAAVPGVTASTLDALRWLFALSRNKITQTATTQTLRNDADSATIAASTHSDDGTTHIRGEFA